MSDTENDMDGTAYDESLVLPVESDFLPRPASSEEWVLKLLKEMRVLNGIRTGQMINKSMARVSEIFKLLEEKGHAQYFGRARVPKDSPFYLSRWYASTDKDVSDYPSVVPHRTARWLSVDGRPHYPGEIEVRRDRDPRRAKNKADRVIRRMRIHDAGLCICGGAISYRLRTGGIENFVITTEAELRHRRVGFLAYPDLLLTIPGWHGPEIVRIEWEASKKSADKYIELVRKFRAEPSPALYIAYNAIVARELDMRFAGEKRVAITVVEDPLGLILALVSLLNPAFADRGWIPPERGPDGFLRGKVLGVEASELPDLWEAGPPWVK